MIPCQKDEDLAWMVFEQFDKDGLVGWRFHKDSFDMRRPLGELNEPSKLPPAAAS